MKDRIVDFNSLMMIIFGICLAAILAFATGEPIPTLFGLLFAVTGGSIIAFRWWRVRSAKMLIQSGIPLKTEFIEVRLNEALQVNGRSPFRIITRWHDTHSNQIRLFESRNIWFDPSSFIKGEEITVYVAPNARRRYYMDTSFLPKLAG